MSNQKLPISQLPSATGFGPSDYVVGSSNGIVSKIPPSLLPVGPTGPIGQNGATGSTGPVGPTGTSVPSVIESTFMELFAASGSFLIPGQYYLITDFQTCYDQPDFDQNGSAIIDNVNSYKTGPNEPLLILATGVDTISPIVYSTEHPSDRILYDPYFFQTERTGNPAKGRIIERIDSRGNRTDYDFRAVKFKRYSYYYSESTFDGTVSIDDIGNITGRGTLFTQQFSIGQVIGIFEGGGGVPTGCFRYYEILTVDSDTAMTVTGRTISVRNNVIYSRGILGSSSCFHQPNCGSLDFNEYYTFEASNVFNVRIGDYANLYNWQENPFLLSNNVFLSGSYENITIGDESYDNTFDDDMNALTFGDNCYRNIITNDFDRNTVGNYFNRNIIICDMADNRIGNYFQFNMLGDNDGPDFDQNRIGNYFASNFITFSNDDFYNNDIGDNFYDNVIDQGFKYNYIIGQFYSNKMFGNFDNNHIGYYFYENVLKDTFVSNEIVGFFYSNQIWSPFYRNKISENSFENTFGTNNQTFDFYDNTIGKNFKGNNIQGEFYGNNIGIEFMANEVLNAFYSNKIGNYCFPNDFKGLTYDNTIGSGFQFNTLYGSFAYNEIGHEFNNNRIQDGFGYGGGSSRGNKIGNNFYNNLIGEYFYDNIIADNFRNNKVFNDFQWNIVSTLVEGSILTSTVFYQPTTVNVFKNNSYEKRISYYDENDVLTIEGLNEVIQGAFTLSSSDFTTGYAIDQNTTPLGTNGTGGFQNTVPEDTLVTGYWGNELAGTSLTQITNSYSFLGFDLNSNLGRVWQVFWGEGSSIQTGLVKFGAGLNGTPYFDIQTIDPSVTAWENNNTTEGRSLTGTFYFPATFRFYEPITTKGGWC